ncbi:MAG: YebC/PmpR family DNA-binding transcriptional regulator [Clostridia bacterium]|nr:YebC/PmpR family DNA-binding transcriptional regulator [Clostridia bacterium]
MAGHSKWANIKHRKSKQDAQKGKIFTKLAREIIVAARQGGGDPAGNFRLRIAIEKAKEANMPNDNINRAIQKGVGGGEAENYEEVVYEGYGPGGVAVTLNIMTNNRNRTAGEIRHLFSKYGGNMGETGCVSWMFDKKGYLTLKSEDLTMSEDDLLILALEAGAEDIKTEDGEIEIFTTPENFEKVKSDLEKHNLRFEQAEITMIPQNTVEITDLEQAKKLMKLMDAFEDHDDVQNVYANFDIDDDLLAQL